MFLLQNIKIKKRLMAHNTHKFLCCNLTVCFHIGLYLCEENPQLVLTRMIHLSIQCPLQKMQMFLLYEQQMCQETMNKIFSTNFKVEICLPY